MNTSNQIHPEIEAVFTRLGIEINQEIDTTQAKTLEMEERAVTVPGKMVLLISSLAAATTAVFLDAWNDFPSTGDFSSFQQMTFAGPDWISEYECLTLHPYLSFLHDQSYSYYLVRADDPNPENPQVYFIDHDSFGGDATPKRKTLAAFLKQLKTKAELEEMMAKSGEAVPDSALLARMGPTAYRQDQTSLSAGGAQITRLDGIEQCPNLQWVDLFSNDIQNLTPLSALEKLESLNMHHNRITDITPLANLSTLKRLYLDHNQIKDIQALRHLSQLQSLSLDNNQIEDLTPLAKLADLEQLGVSANAIEDISPLVNLTGLKNLYLSGNPIQDFSTLKALTQLETLYLADTGFDDARWLSDMHQLQTLRIWGNPDLKHAEILETLPNLEEIVREKPKWMD